MARLLIAAVAIALGVILAGPGAKSQVNPGFNPNTQWGTTWGMIPYRGASTWQGLPPGTAGQVLVSGGVGANPFWNTVTGAGTVTSVSGSGGTTGLTLTGGPITGAGTLTLGGTLAAVNGGTGLASFVAGDLLYASSTTALARRAIGSTGQFLNVVGGVPVWGNIALSNLPTQPTMTVLANITGGSAVPTAPTVTTLLDNAFGSSQGMMLYRGASGWAALPVGNSGEFLRTNGVSNNPQWQAVSGALGGTVTSVTCGAGLTGGTITVTGTCDVANPTTAGQYPGTATNNNATAGNIGEYVSSIIPIGSAVAMSNGTTVNVTSISLTAGDWDVASNNTIALAGGSNAVVQSTCAISQVSFTFPTVPAYYQTPPYDAVVGGTSASLVVPTIRISLASTTTIYNVCVYSAAPAQGGSVSGGIWARRAR